MKNKDIKVHLVRHNNAHDIKHGYEYEVVRIVGAVYVFDRLNNQVRAGDRISELRADTLSNTFEVSVTPYRVK